MVDNHVAKSAKNKVKAANSKVALKQNKAKGKAVVE